MRIKGVHLIAAWLLVGAAPVSALAQVFASEFFSDPVSEGWGLIQQYCDPELSSDQGWYNQHLDMEACPGSTQGGQDSYRRSLESLNGVATFFVEFRLQTDGNSSEIAAGAPAVLAFGNNTSVLYHITVARDLVKFLRDVNLPIWYTEIKPDISHVIRLELSVGWYSFYIDAFLIDSGVPQGPFPAYDSLITWRGKSWRIPCHNAWDYIRYGVIPDNASGDYDSDEAVTLIDHYFVVDCLTKDGPGIFGGPGENAGPGCRFADFDADTDVDLLDFAEFQNGFGPQ